MAKRRSKKPRRKRKEHSHDDGSRIGDDLPLNLIGVATYRQLVDALKKITAPNAVDLIREIRAELDRRRDPVPLWIRKAEDGEEVDDKQTSAQMQRWSDHYGLDNDRADRVLLQISDAVDPALSARGPIPFAELNRLLSNHPKAVKYRMIEVPLRVLTRLEPDRPRVEYIPTTAPREAVNELLGCEESAWHGVPPDGVILYPKGGDTHGPVVMACGSASEPFKAGGVIKGPLTLADLHEKAQAHFMRYVLEDPTDPRRINRSEHQAIVGYNLILRQRVTQKDILGTVNLAWLWPQLRDAIIFEFPKAAFETLYESYRNHFTTRAEKAAGKGATKEDVRKLFLELTSHGADVPLPDKVPFPSCYFALGTGLETELLAPDDLPDSPSENHRGLLLAILLADNGDVVSFFAFINKYADPMNPTIDGVSMAVLWSRRNGKWESPEGMLPWIVPSLIEYVNDHKTLVEEGKRDFAYRRMIERHAKKTRFRPPIPPPFYVVYLQDKIIEEHRRKAIASMRKIEWQHRWQCRGSWNIRVKRGSLPIDPEVEADLRARKYQIFAGIPQMPAELAVELHQRGVAPRGRDEWLAVLRYWRKAHIKGPEDKPIIESVRRSTKKWGDGSNGK